MKTLRLLVDANDLESRASRQSIDRAAEILRGGGTVAFPTETVYGLGAHALDPEAVGKIFAAKQRPAWDPLIVHIGDRAMLERVARDVPENAERLMDVFWPGPLTLLLPKRAEVPDAVTAGLPRVGLRMPAHPVAQALLRTAAIPVAAPSANTFGRTSPTRADHVAEDLDGRIDAILDGGETTHGVESTVADVRDEGCVIFRPGVVTLEQVRAVCRGTVTLRDADAAEETGADANTGPDAIAGAVSPGMALRHYAPRARLVLIDGDGEVQKAAFGEAARECEETGESLGLMLPDAFQLAVIGRRARVYRWGSWADEEELAQRLYAGLRWLDATGVATILCPVPSGKGLAVAIRDRLLKAAR
jgi:L-threonylcarbamoyladenylate synthase